MNTKALMLSSAVFTALLGVAANFLPDEILAFFSNGGTSSTTAADATVVWIVQLAGALYLGFAFLDWAARESAMGGIYGRPLVLGNLMHFLVGALTLWRAAGSADAVVAISALAAMYSVFALLFGLVLFTQPAALSSPSAQT